MTLFKKLALLLIVSAISTLSYAQVRGFNYQAVYRNANGEAQANANLNLRFTIFKGVTGPSGIIVYRETQSVTTNSFGLFTAALGQGSVVSGTFDGVNWDDDRYFLVVDVDESGSWTELGSSEFLEVPVAKYAYRAGEAQIATTAQTADALTNPIWEENGTAVNNLNSGTVSVHNVTIYPVVTPEAIDVDTMISISNGGQAAFITTNGQGQLQVKVNSFSNNPIVTIDDDGAGLTIEEEIRVNTISQNPNPRTVYGNSMPLAYGYLTGLSLSTSYGVSSVNSPNVGEYVITLQNNYNGIPVVIANAYDANNLEHAVYAGYSGSNTVTIKTYDATGNPTSTNFSFTVYGTPAN